MTDTHDSCVAGIMVQTLSHMADSGCIIVFGATGGIGSAVVRQLAGEGSRLVLAGRNREKLEALSRETSATVAVADVTDSGAVDECVTQAQQTHGEICGVAHCVGSLLLKPARLTSDEEWDRAVRLNLTSAFYVLRSAVKAMQATGGSIVLMSSAAAQVGLRNHEAIGAAKAGIEGLMRSAAASHARYGIRVNCVAPGLVETPLTASITTKEASLRAATSMHALGRIGQADEIASAVCWLLDARQGWVTGQVVGVDGGLSRIAAG
jgi:NAD(P)-dependent dehydrogenase (short-subunit alcohol dehydrogenase family)